MLRELLGNSDLIRAGGWVLAAIAALSIVMWVLIVERYVFFKRDLASLVAETVAIWERKVIADPLSDRRLRDGLTSGFHARLASSLGPIQVLAAILPLLGLLGTVIGMIKTFEVMTVFGTGNVRGMADGISQALITTMAGLITAIGGIFFGNQLEQRVERETERLAEHLVDGTVAHR